MPDPTNRPLSALPMNALPVKDCVPRAREVDLHAAARTARPVEAVCGDPVVGHVDHARVRRGRGAADVDSVDARAVDRVEREPHDGADDRHDAVREIRVQRAAARVALGIVADVEALAGVRRRRRRCDSVAVVADLRSRRRARTSIAPGRGCVPGPAPIEAHEAQPRVRRAGKERVLLVVLHQVGHRRVDLRAGERRQHRAWPAGHHQGPADAGGERGDPQPAQVIARRASEVGGSRLDGGADTDGRCCSNTPMSSMLFLPRLPGMYWLPGVRRVAECEGGGDAVMRTAARCVC